MTPQEVFEKTMSRVPAKHRKLSVPEAKAAIEKKMVLMERGVPFNKIIDRPRGFDSFEQACDAIREAEGCSGTAAMSKAADRYPQLLAKFQDEGAVSYRPNFEKAARPQAVQEWDLAVAGVMERDGVTRTAAMSRVRSERPHLYDALQRA